MIVRSFQLADYAATAALLERVLSEACYEETKEAFARQLSWDCEMVLVAVEQESVVGVIIGTIDNNAGYYYRIAVDWSHQRKGIGRALIQALKKRFVGRNVKDILVSVDPHNEPFLPLYESVGCSPAQFSRSKRQLSIVSG